jgi:hypothetical protein
LQVDEGNSTRDEEFSLAQVQVDRLDSGMPNYVSSNPFHRRWMQVLPTPQLMPATLEAPKNDDLLSPPDELSGS